MATRLADRLGKAGFLGAALLLAACASPGGGRDAALSSQMASAPANVPARPAPELKPAPSASMLIGLDTYALREAFGSPEFQRAEPGAEIWRYAGDGCSLFVYLYEDDSATLKTTFVEARAAAGGSVPADPCIDSISRAHQLSAAGY